MLPEMKYINTTLLELLARTTPGYSSRLLDLFSIFYFMIVGGGDFVVVSWSLT
jgi:hypothetical protein